MKKDNKTIAITLRFWTNDLDINHKGNPQKACWDSGMAITEKNETKGIEHLCQPFNNLDDILPLIRELLRKNHILLVSASRRPRVLSHRRRSK